jgi:hypothetical protein
MNEQTTFEEYVKELGLDGMSRADQEEALNSVALTVHKQFLLDLYDEIGEENFKAVKTSAKLGATLYLTTLRHLAPTYLVTYQKAKEKIFSKLKESV